MFFTACAKETVKTSTTYSSFTESETTPNPVIKQAEPTSSMCPDAPKILRSTSKFIKIDHAMSQFEEANKIAVNWCEQFNCMREMLSFKLPRFFYGSKQILEI